jgi:hypothetical protein
MAHVGGPPGATLDLAALREGSPTASLNGLLAVVQGMVREAGHGQLALELHDEVRLILDAVARVYRGFRAPLPEHERARLELEVGVAPRLLERVTESRTRLKAIGNLRRLLTSLAEASGAPPDLCRYVVVTPVAAGVAVSEFFGRLEEPEVAASGRGGGVRCIGLARAVDVPAPELDDPPTRVLDFFVPPRLNPEQEFAPFEPEFLDEATSGNGHGMGDSPLRALTEGEDDDDA